MNCGRSASITVDVPQWRISDDLGAAGAVALSATADGLQIDFGGAHRGPRLDREDRLTVARRLASAIPLTALAVNHANDVGLVRDDGTPEPSAAHLLQCALHCAVAIGIPFLHVPGFRRSAPSSPARVAGTAALLRDVVDEAAAHGVTVAYESALDGPGSSALADAVGRSSLEFVLDVGNLVDAGHSPQVFADTIDTRLHPCAHVKTTVSQPDTDLVTLLPLPLPVQSVLIENDYRAAPDRLAADLAAVRYRLSQFPEGA